MTATLHRKDAPASVRCFVLTISDTRTKENDTSGDAIAAALQAAGHVITGRAIVKDDPPAVQQRGAIRADADVVITTGGTGITSRDSTYEAISRLLEKRIDGFGELFRMLSYARDRRGRDDVAARAPARSAQDRGVLTPRLGATPSSLAMDKLILPEIGHVVREFSR